MIQPKPGSFYEWQLSRHAPVTMSFAAIESVGCPYRRCSAKPGEKCNRVREDPHLLRANAYLQGLYEAWKQKRSAA